MLKIEGTPITCKEGLILSNAAEGGEFQMWQQEKLRISQNKLQKYYWQIQHKAVAKMNPSLHWFCHVICVPRANIGQENQVEQST